MTITLTSEQEKFVAEQLSNGHYRSVDEVIGQSLDMLRAQEEFIRTHTEELRKEIAVGLEQARRGELIDGKAALVTLREKLRQQAHAPE
ncbi:MAG: type II toxin-antitoxin system ParD family antitoxin [Verrucomicrobia bacterium]|nr:type II toxin-antitoxin system ParD family antitoxin [Verrucomicrobiota bacterium]